MRRKKKFPYTQIYIHMSVPYMVMVHVAVLECDFVPQREREGLQLARAVTLTSTTMRNIQRYG